MTGSVTSGKVRMGKNRDFKPEFGGHDWGVSRYLFFISGGYGKRRDIFGSILEEIVKWVKKLNPESLRGRSLNRQGIHVI